jgi:hypothetical protein
VITMDCESSASGKAFAATAPRTNSNASFLMTRKPTRRCHAK